MKGQSIVSTAAEAYQILPKIRSCPVETILQFRYSKEKQFDVKWELYNGNVSSTAKEKLDL